MGDRLIKNRWPRRDVRILLACDRLVFGVPQEVEPWRKIAYRGKWLVDGHLVQLRNETPENFFAKFLPLPGRNENPHGEVQVPLCQRLFVASFVYITSGMHASVRPAAGKCFRATPPWRAARDARRNLAPLVTLLLLAR